MAQPRGPWGHLGSYLAEVNQFPWLFFKPWGGGGIQKTKMGKQLNPINDFPFEC